LDLKVHEVSQAFKDLKEDVALVPKEHKVHKAHKDPKAVGLLVHRGHKAFKDPLVFREHKEVVVPAHRVLWVLRARKEESDPRVSKENAVLDPKALEARKVIRECAANKGSKVL